MSAGPIIAAILVCALALAGCGVRPDTTEMAPSGPARTYPTPEQSRY